MSNPCFSLSCNMGSSAITLEELSCGKGACACGFVVLREGNVPLGRQQVRRQEKSRTACKSWFPLSLQVSLLPVMCLVATQVGLGAH